MPQINSEAELQGVFDLTITKIEDVYFCSTFTWARSTPFARPNDGIVFFTEGSITYDFEGEKITANKGDVLLLPKGLFYSGKRKVGVKNSFFVVDFETDSEFSFEALGLFKVFTPKHYELFVTRFEELLKLWQSGDLSAKIALKGKLYSLIADLTNKYVENGLGAESFSKTKRIADYIDKTYSKSDLSVEDICKEFYISPSTLRRIMLSAYHKTPIKYITEIRIKKAKNMLVYDNYSVSTIAEKCGFSSSHYFSRIFKKEVGVTPMEYKNIKI
ncbi:MAG: helix-turn-helix domain-containing protein [Ruminococcaceae bacterium]|nr:helix-turn-helix domain-containing protein [Oscillospiraceae bacterium]